MTHSTYSPDGRHIISGSYDETIRVWDAVTGAAVGEPLQGHTDWVRSIAYSPDTGHIISASDDKTIRIWDAETGPAVGKPLTGHSGSVSSIAYSPDGSRIVSGSQDGTIKVWPALPYDSTRIPPANPIHAHCYAHPDPDGTERSICGDFHPLW